MEQFIEIKQFEEVGYSPVVAFETWRVAMLNYIDELEPNQITNFQKHDLTDEVFVLLQGQCILFLAKTEENRIVDISPINMETGKIYNIKKGVYHTHTLSKDAKVLIVENDDTSDDNSPKIIIDDSMRQTLVEMTQQLW